MQVLNAVCIQEGKMFINIINYVIFLCSVSSNVLPLK